MCADLASLVSCQNRLSRCPDSSSAASVRRVVVQRATEHEVRFRSKVRVDDCPAMVDNGFALQGGRIK